MAQEPQPDIQTGALWRLRATCVADPFLRDVESADSQDSGRRLMGTGYFVQAVGGYCTTFQNNLFVLLVPASPDSRTAPCPLLALHTAIFKLCLPPEKPPPGGQHCPSLDTMVILVLSFLSSSSGPSASLEKAGQRRLVQSGP